MEKTKFFINGEERFLSTADIQAILEEHFSDTAKTPKEGKWFDVDPSAIDRTLFEEEREDADQELMRLHIQEAFKALDRDPERYSRPYQTMFPAKTWDVRKGSELMMLACCLGDHMTDMHQQSFEWAQRITNGEDWIVVCNTADPAKWSRVVSFNSHLKVVGGSSVRGNKNPPSAVSSAIFYPFHTIEGVASILRYKK